VLRFLITDGIRMPCRLFRKVVQQGRSTRRGEAYALPYVESLERRENAAGGLCQQPAIRNLRAVSWVCDGLMSCARSG
jgi:hypothetical protein